MHYISYRQDGTVIGDYRHGCWGMLSSHYGKTKVNGGVDKIYWEIDQQGGIDTFVREYGCTAQEFFLTLLKGYDVEFHMSTHSNPRVVGIYLKNLLNRNPQETMLRLFGLRTAVYLYNKGPLVKLCKEYGMPLTAAIVITNCFAPKVSNALSSNGSSVVGVTPQFENGGNIGYNNTTLSDFRRFMKGEFQPNKKLHNNDTTWGQAKGYTSGPTGRFVQEACSHAPMGSALLGGWFFVGNNTIDQTMYETSYTNRQNKTTHSIVGSKYSMEVEEFFALMKAILHKKKLPVQRGLPFYQNNNNAIRPRVRETVNPFFKHVDM